MELSRHNILSKIHDSDDYFILNLLYGNADILSHKEAELLSGQKLNELTDFISKGYIVDPLTESKFYRSRYLDFIDNRDTDEVQLFYAPSYACNFNCSYCYQDGYQVDGTYDSKAAAEAFFDYVSSKFGNRKTYVTLFGGEPLLNGQNNHNFLEYFIRRCNDLKLDLAIVTNGFNLAAYLPLLQKATIREIQVTLDGPEQVHNSRRHLKDGKGTFSAIVAGIDRALKLGMPVNLRVVLDRDNIQSLPELAGFAVQRGWTMNTGFKQILVNFFHID